jgi:hypothetical protein
MPNEDPPTNHPVRFIWTLLWKTPVVAVAVVVGALGASGVGFHGAELIAKLPFLKILAGFFGITLNDEDLFATVISAVFAAVIKFAVSWLICVGPSLLVYRIAKPAVFVMIPIFLWVAAVGAYKGIATGFDVGLAYSQ